MEKIKVSSFYGLFKNDVNDYYPTADTYFINEIEKALNRIKEDTDIDILLKVYDKKINEDKSNFIELTFTFKRLENTTLVFKYREPSKIGQLYINTDFEKHFYYIFDKYIWED